MDTPAKIFCGICDAQHITKTADFWCPECDDGLCSECKTHHSFSKSSRHHDVISIENYRKLPTDISSIVHHCIEHEKKLQIYCPHHDQLCCLLCISTSHKDCTGMLPIDEMAKTSKSNGLLESLQKSLEDLKSNIDKIVQDRQINLVKIKEERQHIYADIKQLRKIINSHFDKLEQEIVKELNTAGRNLGTKIEDLLEELTEKTERISVLQNNISDLMNHASDLQTFIGSKKLEEKIESEEAYIQSLIVDERLKQLSLRYTHENCEGLLKNITLFGSISMESSSPSVEIKLGKNNQAQILSASLIPKSVDNIRATLLQRFQLSKGKSNGYNITGCAIFPDRRIIFADCDQNRRLVIFNPDGSLDCEVSLLNHQPFDVTCIDNLSIAFTAWNSHAIHIFDLKSKTVKNTINTNNLCFGIAHNDAKIYYANHESVAVAQMKDLHNSCTIVNNGSSGWRFVALFGETIYFTDRYNNSVSCFSADGGKLWELKDDKLLQDPSGIAVDRYGIVYVALRQKHCIVAISPDGKKVLDILTSADGIEKPYKIFFDNNRNLLLVAGYNGHCASFEIK